MSKSMKLSEYFEKTQGIGVLATNDASGQVNPAIYGRLHFPMDDDDESCSFIMNKRLSHDNVTYLFIEKGKGYVGKWLSLTVIGEETAPEKIKAIRHRNISTIREDEGKYLVHFHIEDVRPLFDNEYVTNRHPVKQANSFKYEESMQSGKKKPPQVGQNLRR